MPDWQIFAVVFAVGAASYAMRTVGFLAADALPQDGLWPRLLRLAPGNLFVAFAAAGILDGGWVSLVGCLGAAATMAVTKREWAALGAGFAVAALASIVDALMRTQR
jgi:branched-subunit amino acid transport protein